MKIRQHKGEIMGRRYLKPDLIDGKVYMCVECSKCKTLLPVALAVDDSIMTVSDLGIGLDSTCYECNHTQNYRVKHAHLVRAKDNHVQLL